MICASRRRRAPDRYLAWKVRAFWLGAALGVLGMWLESGWLLAPAAVVLLAGILLRFLPAHASSPSVEGADGGDGPGAVN